MFKYGKDTNAFRLTPEQANELNGIIEKQPAEHTQTNGKPDLRKLVIYAIKCLAHTKTSTVNSPAVTETDIELMQALEGFREETNIAFAELFKRRDLQPISRTQMMRLMLDYCQADPGEEAVNIVIADCPLNGDTIKKLNNLQFPRPEISKTIFKELTANEKREGTAAVKTDNGNTAAGESAGNTGNGEHA